MADQKPLSQQQAMELERKLRRRERRIQERLQEAQDAFVKAQERLKRAENRVQKRQDRVQRMENRLIQVHQQLADLLHQQGRPVQEVEQAAALPAASPEETTTLLAASAEETATSAEPVPAGDKSVSSSPPSTETSGFARIARAVAETTERAARAAMERAIEVASHLEQMNAARHSMQEPLETQSEAEAQEHEQTVQEVEQPAQDILQQEQVSSHTDLAPAMLTEQQENALFTQGGELPPAEQPSPQVTEPGQLAAPTTQADVPSQRNTEALPTSTEEPAPFFLQEEAAASPSLETAAPSSVEEAASPSLEEPAPPSLEEESASPSLEEAAPPSLQEELLLPSAEESVPSSLQDKDEQRPVPSAAQPENIEEIEEEEGAVAAVAAMMIADVAAAAAAEAEALAEASSVRTRNARYQALRADQVLDEVRSAIASGALTGEEAEIYLEGAERNATSAHAILADAEAAEEQARNAAMNAEAEAEVAEGMAFAAEDIVETPVEQNVPPLNDVHNEHKSNITNNESDITQKMPVIQPQETE
ncbi:MAG: hypothetical protein ACJ788_19900 [Ktedonobacteraceae bacterium]